jgi:DNA-binding GntR family transcriptional regulator
VSMVKSMADTKDADEFEEIAAVRAGGTRSRGTTVDRIVEYVREGILFARFAPGQRLVEVDLTAELGVSRGSLREAFRRLGVEGLIETVPNRGAIVRRLSLKETAELFQIRSALETLAARLAAQNVSDANVRRSFEEAVQPIWGDQPRIIALNYLDENKLFHQAVADASGNRQLAELVRRLQLPLILYQTSGALTPEILALANTEHRAIATAILTGDAHAAEEGMRNHLDRASRLAYALPAGVFRP